MAARTCLSTPDRPAGGPDEGAGMMGELVGGYGQSAKAVTPVLSRIGAAERYWPDLVRVKGRRQPPHPPVAREWGQ
ncbi:hypothetical protein [Streptomyces atratus]|uniref:hypothetical protein n=1 Tax=Streptomyces atratus TaxID=1893 RepID=UPI003792F699